MKNTQNSIFAKLGIVLGAMALILIPTIASAEITTTLKTGSRSSDVTELQTFLATDSTIYPQGLVTGYFGFLTKAAVSNFQSRNGLSKDGIVGPMTRAVINQQLGGNIGNNGNAPTISGVYVSSSRNNANVIWNTNTPAQGKVFYSSSPLTTYEYENSVDVSGQVAMTDLNARTSQNVSLSSLQAGTTYYYLVYTTGQNGNVSVTWPATFMTAN